jgi:hypothetical protein
MPPEIYAVSGAEIVSTLKARRSHIEEEATTYYKFIAKEVDIVGSKKRELVEVDKRSNETVVNLYKINKEGETKKEPFYSRVFKNDETDEIRVYGISGNDNYILKGDADNGIKVRVIGGIDRDSIVDQTTASAGSIHVYDNKDNIFTGANSRLHLSEDTTINSFKYGSYLYSKKGTKPIVFYDNDDRLYVGLIYGTKQNRWRKSPFAYKQSLEARYSITQGAFRFLYKGLFTKAIGNWDIDLSADYDLIKWRNFYGLGNETSLTTKDTEFNRMLTEEFIGNAGIRRRWGNSTLLLSGFFQSVNLINDTARFVAKSFSRTFPVRYKTDYYTGAQADFTTFKVNDAVVPTRGYGFFGNVAYSHNIKDPAKSFTRYTGDLHLFVPLVSKFSLAVRVGSESITGNPEFYQYNFVGGGQTIRGYRRERFWGNTTFYNSNTLRFINDVHSYLFNGKLGVVAFFDNGRVWMPSQKSNTLHTGYGAGILIAPFNKIAADITYSISEESRMIQLRVFKPFR